MVRALPFRGEEACLHRVKLATSTLPRRQSRSVTRTRWQKLFGLLSPCLTTTTTTKTGGRQWWGLAIAAPLSLHTPLAEVIGSSADPTRDYGSRKLIQVTGLPRSPLNHLTHLPKPSLAAFRGASSSSSSSSSGRGRYLSSRHSDSSLPVFSGTPSGYSSSSPASSGAGAGGAGALSGSHVMKPSTKSWLHPPESLVKGELAYNVKFLGECAVDQPKGTDTVKDAIRKRKFDRQIKRAEGQKAPKVQLIISVDGVRIEHPKSRVIIHEYPLHRISYCADDKSDKKMFTFIAKAATTNDHYCYVFNCSDKSAEEITLTVGQAFDLAYRRFLEEGSSGVLDKDYKKQCLLLQRRVNSLQFENDALRKRVSELEKLKDRADLEEYMKNNQPSVAQWETSQQQQQQQSQVGRRLQNLILEEEEVVQSNGSASSSSGPQFPAPVLSPPPQSSRQTRSGPNNVSVPVRQQSCPTNPFSSGDASTDPFGMGEFNPSGGAPSPAVGAPAPNNGASVPAGHDDVWGTSSSQQELLDIQAGFSRGLSFGTDDFSLDDLDPLNQGKQ